MESLLLSELQAIRKDSSETKVMVGGLRQDFDKHSEQMKPIYEDHIYNKIRKKERADRLRHWGWRIGIISGALTIAGVFYQWG